MNILYGYPNYPAQSTYGDAESLELQYLDRLNQAGFSITPFCLTVNPPNHCFTFPELDKRWKTGDKELFKLYEQLEQALEGHDVFINAAGINLHPDFVQKLNIFKVFGCNDDPENSHNLSYPAAHAYDLCLVGNIAEVATYKSWGIKNVEWSPLGLQDYIYPKDLTYEKILEENRDIDLFMMIDKLAPWRREKMNLIDAAFPNAHFYGNGWKRGFLKGEDQLDYLRRSKIGLNFHNSTGPINFRTFYLPANGVMQICDNKSFLKEIYELDKEVIGFDNINECIDKCRYYLAHDEERRLIAANGWRRAVTDYNEVTLFAEKVKTIKKYMPPQMVHTYVNQHITLTTAEAKKVSFTVNKVYFILKFPATFAIKVLRYIRKKLLK